MIIQTKPLQLGTLSSYGREEAKIKVKVTLFCTSGSDLCYCTGSTLEKSRILFFKWKQGSLMPGWIFVLLRKKRTCITEVNVQGLRVLLIRIP